MTSLWPWLAVAGAGALHGLNPATGWMLAAAWGLRSHERMQALRALVPIALGHVAAIAVAAGAAALGLALDRFTLEAAACVLLLGAAAIPLSGRTHARLRMPAGHAGLALWSFVMATVHGAGLMLVPALIPICAGAGRVREITASGSLALALAAICLHTAAMLAVTGVAATWACRGIGARLAATRRARGAARSGEMAS